MKVNILFLLITAIMVSAIALTLATPEDKTTVDQIIDYDIQPTLYKPEFDPLNINEEMTLSPLFSPDNSVDIYYNWMLKANTSIIIQNQYIRQWDTTVSDISEDPSPIIQGVIKANERGVNVKIQINAPEDLASVEALVYIYLNSLDNVEVRFMGNSETAVENNWLSSTHNKLVIIDAKVVIVSSVNYSRQSLTQNREAGMVIQNDNAAVHFSEIFELDWNSGEEPPTTDVSPTTEPIDVETQFISHTEIPKANFTGMYNITLITNPDNADKVIFDYLKSAKESIYVGMYTISRTEFVDTLIDLKQANTDIKIEVLVSHRRIGGTENTDTREAIERLTEALIPVYNSSIPDHPVGLYHSKYWIIDGKHTFVYSGNWSPRSVTAPPSGDTYASSFPNRDMGVAVHNAPDIANFFKEEVWDKDVAVGTPFELPIGISQTSFRNADILSGEVTFNVIANDITNTSYSYIIDDIVEIDVEGDDSGFSFTFDTNDLINGVHIFEFHVDADEGTFTDKLTVNIANYDSRAGFRLLLTEILPDPDIVSDALGEFVQITNSFPFEILIEDWSVDISGGLLIFPSDYIIPAYTSIIIARNAQGFQDAYNVEADFQASFVLGNQGGVVSFYNHRNEVIDSIAYGTGVSTDGSTTVGMPGPEISIQRSPLHQDTNTLNDFKLAAPNPKGPIPHVSLDEFIPTFTNGDENPFDELSWDLKFIFLIFMITPIIRKVRKNLH
jgi:phosphatidylserine/phosphatidylglycerophosphate/cardiolipin synthase-like enzyme